MVNARERAKAKTRARRDCRSRVRQFSHTCCRIPLARQIAGSLKAENYAFTVSTPGRGLRLAWIAANDFVELTLDSDGRATDRHGPGPPHARVAHARRRAPGQTGRLTRSVDRGRGLGSWSQLSEPRLER